MVRFLSKIFEIRGNKNGSKKKTKKQDEKSVYKV